MHDFSQNNLVRFKNVSSRKGELFANYRVKGLRGGTEFTANISVSIDAADVDLSDPLEVIIEKCAEMGVRQFKACDFIFEGLVAV